MTVASLETEGAANGDNVSKVPYTLLTMLGRPPGLGARRRRRSAPAFPELRPERLAFVAVSLRMRPPGSWIFVATNVTTHSTLPRPVSGENETAGANASDVRPTANPARAASSKTSSHEESARQRCVGRVEQRPWLIQRAARTNSPVRRGQEGRQVPAEPDR